MMMEMELFFKVMILAILIMILIFLLSKVLGWKTKVNSSETQTESENFDLGIVDPSSIVTAKSLIEEIFFASHKSASENYADRCIALLRRKPQYVNFRLEPTGYTPFLDACFAGSHKLVEYMLQHGAKTDSTALDGTTPIYLATVSYNKKEGFNPSLLQALVNFGCSVNQPKGSGHTPLHAAAKIGNFELVRWLLVHKADAEAITSTGRTPADIARESGHQKIQNFLTVRCDTGSGSSLPGRHPPSVTELDKEQASSASRSTSRVTSTPLLFEDNE